MIEFENIIDIKKPPEEVFAFIANFENMSKWNYYVLKVKKTSEGPLGAGTLFHQKRKVDQQSFKIVEYEPGKKVSIQTLADSTPAFEMCFSFESVQEGTRLTDRWKLYTGKTGLIEKLFKFKVKNAVRQNLMKLKNLLENGSVRLEDGRSVQI